MRAMRQLIGIGTATVLAASVIVVGCGGDESGDGASKPTETDNLSAAPPPLAGLPQGSEPVKLDPAEFTTEIDNPYWPMSPGSRWVYRETDGEGNVQRVVVMVTDRTKRIANGIEARVVRDVVSEDGEPVEITDDWYAQDADGNVWYLGERTAEYEHGEVVTRAGSFEAGVDGAQAGVIMPADPKVGMSYRQEYYAGEAEDEGSVLSLDEQVQVAGGRYEQALMTRDTNPLEPKVSEHKFYAEGVGPVLTLDISGGTGREELLSFRD
jgi:hypothetical protein